jgi:hypothetical protein
MAERAVRYRFGYDMQTLRGREIDISEQGTYATLEDCHLFRSLYVHVVFLPRIRFGFGRLGLPATATLNTRFLAVDMHRYNRMVVMFAHELTR